ncbi:hypothetical protein J1N35_004729, partial [Gossypium stocksii]
MDSGGKRDRKDQLGETLEESYKTDMDSGGKRDRKDQLVIILEVGIEALTRVAREVLEKVFEARLKKTKEMVQGRCVNCTKKTECSPSRLEPRSVKHVRSQLSVSK